MKSSRIIMALWLGTTAWATTLPQKQPANPPATEQPSSAKSAPASSASQDVKSRSASPAKPAAQASATKPNRGKKAIRRTVSRKAEPPKEKPKSATGKPGAIDSKGKRDPFVSPVVERARVANCTGSGRQCLAVSDISLQGVVQSSSGFIAVVVNGTHTYFLRENDPLADGAVERITRDAIILHERSSDALGRPLVREVTKRLGAPAV